MLGKGVLVTQSILSNHVQSLYEPRIHAARTQFVSNSAVSAIIAPDMEPIVLELFFIYYNALGVNMTEPVEGWIHRAGVRCEEIGLTELGRSLRAHAKHEAGHHLMMIEDTQNLVAYWNKRHSLTLDADQLLAQPMTPSVVRYRQLHEDVIASDAPFGQLAIEYEIEGLSVSYVPHLMDQCARLVGPTVVEALSFLQEHVEIDVAHTQFNNRQLEQFLTQYPEYVTPLVNAGAAALDAYAGFLNDCLDLAKAQLKESK